MFYGTDCSRLYYGFFWSFFSLLPSFMSFFHFHWHTYTLFSIGLFLWAKHLFKKLPPLTSSKSFRLHGQLLYGLTWLCNPGLFYNCAFTIIFNEKPYMDDPFKFEGCSRGISFVNYLIGTAGKKAHMFYGLNQAQKSVFNVWYFAMGFHFFLKL